MEPFASTLAGPDLATARSACSVMVVVTRLAGAEPFPYAALFRSVEAVAAATLTSVPVAGAVTVTERVTLAPLARLATVGQVTTPAACVPPLVAEANVAPAGSVSRTTTLAAVEGPLLVTTIV